MKTKEEVIKVLENELLVINYLYKSNCVNWRSTTTDTNELCSEIIAMKLSKEMFNKIKIIKREKTYCRDNHNSVINKNSNRYEENFAKQVTGYTLGSLGTIMDYQVPLKNIQSDKVGKIDMISFNKNTKTLYLIELKYGNNKETLLRAILESYTYYKILENNKLILNCFKDEYTNDEIIIKPAVLAVPNCNAYEELEEIKKGKRPNLKTLINELGVSCFVGTFEAIIKNTEMNQVL